MRDYGNINEETRKRITDFFASHRFCLNIPDERFVDEVCNRIRTEQEWQTMVEIYDQEVARPNPGINEYLESETHYELARRGIESGATEEGYREVRDTVLHAFTLSAIDFLKNTDWLSKHVVQSSVNLRRDLEPWIRRVGLHSRSSPVFEIVDTGQ